VPIPEALTELSRHGITRVEYATFNLIMSSTNAGLRSRYLEDRNAWGLREADIPAAKINEIARSLGISPVQVHCPDYDLADPEPRKRSQAVEMTERLLNLCEKMGAPTLVVHASTRSSPTDGGKATGRLCESLNSLAGSASDLGCRIAVENGWRDMYGSRADDLVELIEESDPDNICACLDTGHGHRLGSSPASMARKIGKYLGATHIHDYDGASDHLPPFLGDIDWDELVLALSEVGYGNELIGEIEGFVNVDDGIIRSKAAMEKLLGLFDIG
jgi:sugar phosphate isomerase/epimerase